MTVGLEGVTVGLEERLEDLVATERGVKWFVDVKDGLVVDGQGVSTCKPCEAEAKAWCKWS